MGRYISCGIVTKIEVNSKGYLQKNKKDLLQRKDKIFILKYYEEEFSDSDDYMCLYLKEDLFNKNFKNLLLELNELDLFTNYFYDNIKSISNNSYTMSQKDSKKTVWDYLENNFDFNKIISEDITATLKFLNNFIRKSLKNDLKNTLIFGLAS